MFRALALALVVATTPLLSAANPPPVTFSRTADVLTVHIAGQPVADYVTADEHILRPYFRHLRTLSGGLVTRRHPPQKPADLDDHPTMHPGLWLAFGDLSGSDFWRNKAQVAHHGFTAEPQGTAGRGTFSVRNHYRASGRVLCTEDCSLTFHVRPTGYLIDWQSTFHTDTGDFTFGDQEEMGLGVRVASPLAVVNGGQILNSDNRKNGAEVWGQPAAWCAYHALLDNHQRAIMIMPDPHNFRASWFHARDYGLLVANPFGQRAFTKGDKSSTRVAPGKPFTLRFGIVVSETPADSPLPFADVYREFVQSTATNR